MLVSRVWLGDPPIKEFILIFFTIFFTAVKWVAALLKAFTLKRVVNTKKCRTLPSPTHHCLVFWAAWWINAHKMGEMDSWKWIFFIRLYFKTRVFDISPFYQKRRETFKRVQDHLCLSSLTQYLCCRQYLVLLVAQSVSQLSTLSVTVAPPSPIQHTRKIEHQPQTVVPLSLWYC